jgi:hypothetical protein
MPSTGFESVITAIKVPVDLKVRTTYPANFTPLLNGLNLFEHVQRMEENRIPKRVLYMNLGTKRFRGRSRNRWQDEVREEGRIVGEEGWEEKYITERNG